MTDIKKLRKAVETLDEMVAEGELWELPDEVMDREDFTADFGICLLALPEYIESIPDIWKDQIAYSDCAICHQRVFYRDNMPKRVKLICMPCSYIEMSKLIDNGDEISLISRECGREELRQHLKKKEEN